MGRQRADILHRDLSKERQRGREEKSKSRDLSNGSLKTDWEIESRKPTLISRKGGGGREEKRKSRDLSNRSLKTDGETVRGELTYGSLERERGKERKRARAEI